MTSASRLTALAPALALALALVGCSAPADSNSCGSPHPPAFGSGHRVVVYSLNDGNLDRRLCVTLNDAGPWDGVVHRTNSAPNVATMANVSIVGPQLHIEAWIAGETAHATFDHDSALENYVVITTHANGTLSIGYSTQQPVFD